MKSILQSAKWMSYIYRCHDRQRSHKDQLTLLARKERQRATQDLEDYCTFYDPQPSNEVIIQRLTRRYNRLQSQLEAIKEVKKLLNK